MKIKTSPLRDFRTCNDLFKEFIKTRTINFGYSRYNKLLVAVGDLHDIPKHELCNLFHEQKFQGDDFRRKLLEEFFIASGVYKGHSGQSQNQLVIKYNKIHNVNYRLKHYGHLAKKTGKKYNHIWKALFDETIQEALEEQSNKLSHDNIHTYRKLCEFRLMPEHLSKIKGYDLLLKYGWYHPVDNVLGVTKDHQLSIKDGLEQQINPFYMSHYKNCEFLHMRENSSKNSRSSISFKKLKFLIEMEAK